MIALFTDFGINGPYIGQMKSVLLHRAPGVEVIDLFVDAPAYDPQAAAYLLAAYVGEFAAGTIFLCVVDPGVGGDRVPCLVQADRRWFVGPDNGLFEIIIRRAPADVLCWSIDWIPPRLSASFHGRDLFAPIAAALARGESLPVKSMPIGAVRRPEWPDNLPRTIYVDAYGNVMTGLRAAGVPTSATVVINGIALRNARTFSEVPKGSAFWYENSNGLLEIAVNMERAADRLNLRVGMSVHVET